jgi:3-dehydroquinate dehydratase-1
MFGKICVSIAAEDPEALKEQINKALVAGADYVEIRFDFLKISQVEQALKIAEKVREKSVFTLRSSEQGGKFKGSTTDRIYWLKKLSITTPMLLDVEYNTIQGNDDFADYLKVQKIPILVSWHDFQKTPQYNELIDILEKMRIYSNYIKIVTTALNIQDALRLLDLYETAAGLNLIAFAMGEAGVISRILCTLLGKTPFTYAGLEEAIAPAQLTIKQMRKIYDRINFLSNRV